MFDCVMFVMCLCDVLCDALFAVCDVLCDVCV